MYVRRICDVCDGERHVIVKKVRGAIGAAPGLVLMAAVAVLAAACSNSGNPASSTSGAPGGSPAVSAPASAASGAPADTSTAASSNPAASAVAVSVAAPPSASAPAQLPTSGAAAGTTSCATWAAAHTFLYVTSATPDADGSLTVTGNHAAVVCGGPDDYHYDFAAAAVTGRVLPGAALRVLSSGAHLQPLTLPKFPAYLTTDKSTRVFMFTGALTGITTLSEQYHP
jgi:hypothetical protein